MKKIICLLLSLLLCVSLFGCSSGEVVQNTSSVPHTSATATDAVQKEQRTQKNSTTAVTDKAETTAKPSSSADAKSTTATEKSTRLKSNSVSSATQKHTAGKTVTAKKSTVKATTTVKKKKATTTNTTIPKSITCTVFIDCSSILDNMENLKPGHEAFVPNNGIILHKTSVTVSGTATAYDAVKLACEKSGVKMNVSSSGFGKYIAGFDNIDEKDCGAYSGWKYKVNDTYPSKSCDKYKLNQGDSIVFLYTC